MKIAVIGTGSVGGTLGRRWAELGHSVTFGSSKPEDAKETKLVASIKGQASVTGVREAAAEAEVVVLAIPWKAVEEVIATAGNLKAKIIFDITNPPNSAIPPGSSGAQEIAKLASGARVFKAMNHTGYENMADPSYPGGRPVMFAAGDDPEGKAIVLSLMEELGFEAVDAGGIAYASLLEDLAALWIHLMYRQKFGRDFAFALLRR